MTTRPPFMRPDVPAVGETVDRSFEVALSRLEGNAGIAIAAEGALIRVSRASLERDAAYACTDWTTEEERHRLIRADRARLLLACTGQEERPGTIPVAASHLGEAVYLVADLLETGQAAVDPDGSRDPADRIMVRYRGSHPDELIGSGDITFHLPGSRRPFLSVSWFVA